VKTIYDSMSHARIP